MRAAAFVLFAFFLYFPYAWCALKERARRNTASSGEQTGALFETALFSRRDTAPLTGSIPAFF